MKRKKRLVAAILIAGTVLLSGCTQQERQTSQAKPAGQETGTEETAGAYTWQEITVTVPKEWDDHYVVKENESGFYFYQKASYVKDEGLGYLIGFSREEQWMEELTGERLLAYTDDGKLYYAMFPTDVSCDTEDKEILDEYIAMEGTAENMADGMQVSASGIHFDAEEYQIPTSSIAPLTKDQLVNFSDNDLWIARNEIYARHGRGFLSEYLQGYFDACSWYRKIIEADAFDESTLSRLERDNLFLISAAEEAYAVAHPYPKEYKTGTTVKDDLSGSGSENAITYTVKEKEDNDYSYVLTIDGTTYDLADYIVMATPVTDVFYVTDIAEYKEGLEIAILDEGPSGDPETHFFQYDGTVSYLGSMEGFPFKQQNGGWNGFDGANLIKGRVRMDLIETCYLDGYWWYDENQNKLVYHEDGEHQYQPYTEHDLLMDLPVSDYEGNETAVIASGQKIYFLRSDMQERIYVRAKDGSEGYIKVKDQQVLNVGKPAEEVFSNLQYFD